MIQHQAFNALGLSPDVLSAINRKGFETPTPIQSMTIPVMLRNEANIIAQAQTGTGKTAAFGLPLIEMINPNTRTIQALILVPTRELAIQVAEEIDSLKGDKALKIVPVYGGQPIGVQLRALKEGVHIVVGTPGRIIDHLNRKTLKPEKIDFLILDEADEMLNMGFIEDIEKIMEHTNPHKRTLLFSATIPQRIKSLAHKYMDGYEFITVKKETLTTGLTKQIYLEVKSRDKLEALCRIIDIQDDFYGLVFCRTKNDVDSVVRLLTDRGYDAEAIHGDISQAQRERTLEKFKQQKVNILIATDVAARGIDVNNLTHVINYSLPQNPDSYVHRIGRTGRAGKEGTAITFITPGEYKQLMFIQHKAKSEIKKARIPKINEIIEAKKKKIYDDLNAILNEDMDAKFYDWAGELLEENDSMELMAAMLKYFFEEELNPEAYGKIKEVKAKEKSFDRKQKTRLFIALGKRDKITARKLIDLIKNRVSLKPAYIQDVQVMDHFSFMTVPSDKAKKIIGSFKQRGKKPLITYARQNGM